jgi:hypothetical protein
MACEFFIANFLLLMRLGRRCFRFCEFSAGARTDADADACTYARAMPMPTRG